MSKPSFTFLIALLLIIFLVTPGSAQTRVGKFGVGVDGSIQNLVGAGGTNPSPGIGYGVSLSYSVMEYFGIRSKLGINQLGWEGSLGSKQITDLMSLNFYLSADLMPNSEFNIFPFVGTGLAFYDPKNDDASRANKSSFDIHMIGGLGADYFLNEFWSLTVMGEYVFTNSAYYAGSVAGGNPDNDSFMRFSLQVRYYFFDQPFIIKLLDAQRERLKRSR